MSLNFPSSPTAGQTYPSPPISGLPVYTWDGEKWTTIGGNIGTGYAPLDSPLFIGDPRGPTPLSTDNDNSLATTAFVIAAIAIANVASLATAAEFIGNAQPNKTLTPGAVWGAALPFNFGSASSIVPNLAVASDFLWTVNTGSGALSNPNNAKQGQKGVIYMVSGGNGANVTSWGTGWKFPNGVKPTMTGILGIWDTLSYVIVDPTPGPQLRIHATFSAGFA